MPYVLARDARSTLGRSSYPAVTGILPAIDRSRSHAKVKAPVDTYVEISGYRYDTFDGTSWDLGSWADLKGATASHGNSRIDPRREARWQVVTQFAVGGGTPFGVAYAQAWGNPYAPGQPGGGQKSFQLDEVGNGATDVTWFGPLNSDYGLEVAVSAINMEASATATCAVRGYLVSAG